MRRSFLPAGVRAPLLAALLAACVAGLAPSAALAKLLIPMDDHQTDHLKAYGLTYWVLAQGQKGEWLLNYRGGSFLLAETPENEREANIRGVSFEHVAGGQEAQIRAEIADNNMEAVALAIKDYIGRGGFMFGMCSATDTYDIALAAEGVDIADMVYDGDPADPLANRKLDMSRTLAFKDFRLELDPMLYKFSDIDV